MDRIQFGNKLNSAQTIDTGKGLKSLIIAGIGTSSVNDSINIEYKKAGAAISAGADIISDHSFYGDINSLHRHLIGDLGVHLSVVASYELSSRYNLQTSAKTVSKDNVLSLIAEQIDRGIDIITIHATLLAKDLETIKKTKRVIPMTSKGGGIIAKYIADTSLENPYWELFDELLQLVSDTGVAISLGTSFRPGSVCDKWDDLSEVEITRMSELVKRADKANVPIMVEGLGHISIDSIEPCILRTKKKCFDAPYRILTVATDRAMGNDHIASAIAVAVAIANGANLVQAVTRREHIGRPSIGDVVEAVSVARTAATIGELVSIGDYGIELEMSRARWEHGCKGNIELAISPQLAYKSINNEHLVVSKNCSMCGKYCGLEYARNSMI
jgi:phosphomethylpyrimidine synthase